MKELFRSKGMMGFLVIIVSLTVFTSKPNDSMINLEKNQNQNVSVNV